MKHVAIYLRVSSKQQDVDSQVPDLKRWAEGQSEPVEWYEDVFTGRSMDRPGWNKLMEDVRSGKVSSIVAWRLDRFGRTVSGLAPLFDELIALNVNLVSLREGIHLNTAAGRMIAHVLASMAQFETELRGERVRAGQAVKRALGKRWGGSKKGRVTKQTLTSEQIRTIRKLKNDGEGVATIARVAKVSRQTVYKHLQVAVLISSR